MQRSIPPQESKAPSALFLCLAIAASPSFAQETETPQTAAVAKVFAEACRDQKLTGAVPETVWNLIDQQPLSDELGKGWAAVKRKTSLDGWSGANCWVESQHGDLVLGGALSAVWGDKRPSFVLFKVRTVGDKTMVVPGTLSQGNTKNYLRPYQFDLGKRVTPGNSKKFSFEEFSTTGYCESREKVNYAPYQPVSTMRGKMVLNFWADFNERGEGFLRSSFFERYFDFAPVAERLETAVPNWRTLEPDFGRPVRGWPMKIVGESGELVMALQSDEKGTPARYWVFRLPAVYPGFKIAPVANVVGNYLQIYPHVASFHARESRDLGKSELELLDSYCQAMRPAAGQNR